MHHAQRSMTRIVTLAVWAALVSIAFAASAAARVEIRVLDRPVVLVLAHGQDRVPARHFDSRSASDDDFIDPQIAVTNVGPPIETIPSVTIASNSQSLSLIIETGSTVEAPTTSSLPTVEGTSETNTTTTAVDGPDGELSYTGPRGSLMWELVIAGSMVVIGARMILGGRRRRERFQ